MHTFSMSSHEGFSILITLWGVDALLVSQYLIVNDMKCDYSFRAMMLMSWLVLLVLLVLTGKGEGKWLI